MSLTRRSLLASLAAVAAAAVVPGASASAIPGPTARERRLRDEHAWVVDALAKALESDDFSAFVPGREKTRPARWRLARVMMELRDLEDPTPLERTLSAEVSDLWWELTRHPGLVEYRPPIHSDNAYEHF